MNKPLRKNQLSKSARRKMAAAPPSPVDVFKAEAAKAFVEGDYPRARQFITQALTP